MVTAMNDRINLDNRINCVSKQFYREEYKTFCRRCGKRIGHWDLLVIMVVVPIFGFTKKVEYRDGFYCEECAEWRAKQKKGKGDKYG